eukprot:TRINITY_DN20740_c2_g1_i1.p1 TRINITY_DN20740_c2_g1~~TRINITY_DN20740_c2_g1_i1.p1  ORF type:complete len:333 (+),score=28.64 TRINITY_DN20740_c2_g1_i1:67-999(+)
MPPLPPCDDDLGLVSPAWSSLRMELLPFDCAVPDLSCVQAVTPPLLPLDQMESATAELRGRVRPGYGNRADRLIRTAPPLAKREARVRTRHHTDSEWPRPVHRTTQAAVSRTRSPLQRAAPGPAAVSRRRVHSAGPPAERSRRRSPSRADVERQPKRSARGQPPPPNKPQPRPRPPVRRQVGGVRSRRLQGTLGRSLSPPPRAAMQPCGHQPPRLALSSRNRGTHNRPNGLNSARARSRGYAAIRSATLQQRPARRVARPGVPPLPDQPAPLTQAVRRDRYDVDSETTPLHVARPRPVPEATLLKDPTPR